MRRPCLALLLGLSSTFAAPVAAQEDGQLRLMREPHSYVDVADALDDDDPFDINVTIGFERRWIYGNIQRENNTAARDPNRMSQNWQDIAHHTFEQNRLNLGLEIGIFRDLMIYGRLPIILSDDRRLQRINGRDPAGDLQADDIIDRDGDGMDDLDPGRVSPGLFDVPFTSPTRSGLDYLVVGAAWSIFNQNRDRELPTWLLMVEGRFNLGDPMVACRGGASNACRRWQESNNNWTYDDAGTDAGETRGTNALRIETRASWRTRYVEPFAGLSFQIEWPDSADQFFLPAGNLGGFINSQPPILGQLTGGMAIIPWENRAGWQRFAIDVRLMGKYVSEGHGYSPLFDALGTSQNRHLTSPNLEGSPGSGADLRTVPFFGLTDVAPHAELGAQLGIEVRAARFVRFSMGAMLWYLEPYVITYTDACNPNAEVPAGDPRIGSCRSGIVNPHHRPVLDLPGQTFRVNEQVRLDFYVNATGMF